MGWLRVRDSLSYYVFIQQYDWFIHYSFSNFIAWSMRPLLYQLLKSFINLISHSVIQSAKRVVGQWVIQSHNHLVLVTRRISHSISKSAC
jgi:hypothetical protein